MAVTKGKPMSIGAMKSSVKPDKGMSNAYKGKNADVIVPGGQTAQGLRTALAPKGESAAHAHVKKHIC